MNNSIIEKVEAEIAVSEAKEDKKKRVVEKLKYILVGIILLTELIVLCGQLYNRFIPNMQYKEAISYYNEDQIKEALLMFEKLGEYKNSEYYCNIICADNPSFRFDHCKIGDEITFGQYYYEDIEWVVIDISDDNVLLLSKDIIEADTFPSDAWFTSFVKNSFTGNEQSIIDSAYLLSSSDAFDYLNDKKYAKTTPTAHALSNEEYEKDPESGYLWWLDTKSSYSSEHRVSNDKNASGYEYLSDSKVGGIRPALSININS